MFVSRNVIPVYTGLLIGCDAKKCKLWDFYAVGKANYYAMNNENYAIFS